MKSRIDEIITAKAQMSEELEAEKKSRVGESSELRRQLKDLTESSELETRTKNDKIKRLQNDCEQLRREKMEAQS